MFSRLFRRKKSAPETVGFKHLAAPDPSQQSPALQINALAAPSADEIDYKFISLLMGVHSPIHSPIPSIEKKKLERIQLLSQKKHLSDNLIPRLPAVMPKILRTIRDENATAQDLADLISSDISLVADVIRLSNSAYYRTSEKITSLKQAIVQLGMQGIRQLILDAVLKPILSAQSGHLTGISSSYLWDKNQKAAMAASCIAKNTGDDQFHSYLSGLLSQTGILIVMRHLDQVFSGADIHRSSGFMTELNRVSKQVTIELCEYWEMPTEVTQTLSEQYSATHAEDMTSLGTINYLADKLAKMSILVAKGNLPEQEYEIKCHLNGDISSLCQQCYNLINLAQES